MGDNPAIRQLRRDCAGGCLRRSFRTCDFYFRPFPPRKSAGDYQRLTGRRGWSVAWKLREDRSPTRAGEEQIAGAVLPREQSCLSNMPGNNFLQPVGRSATRIPARRLRFQRLRRHARWPRRAPLHHEFPPSYRRSHAVPWLRWNALAINGRPAFGCPSRLGD